MPLLHSLLREYGVAFLVTGCAFLVTLAVGAWSERTALGLYACAAVVGAYFNGPRAGLLSTVFTVLLLLGQYLLLPVTSPLRQAELVSTLLLVAAVCALASYLGGACGEAVAAVARSRPTPDSASNEAKARPLEHFQRLAAAAPTGMILLNPDGQCVFSNPACRAAVGLASADVTDDGWTRFVHPKDQEFAAEWRDAARKQEHYTTELRFRNSDGRVRWAQLRAAPLRGADGTYLGHLGILDDLTSWKEVEDELGRQEKLVADMKLGHQQQVGEIERRLAGIQKAQGLLQEQLAEQQRAAEDARQRHAQEQAEGKRAEERLREENTELCLANTVLEEQLAEARNGKGQRAEFERQQAEWKRAEEKLRRDLAEQRKGRQAAEESLTELRRTHEEGRSKLESQQAEWKRAEDKLRRQVGELTDTTKLLEDELSEWQQKEKQLRGKQEQMQKELENVRTRHHDDHRQFEEARARWQEERARWQREQAEREEKWKRGESWFDRVAERLRPLTQELEEVVQGSNRSAVRNAVKRLTLFTDGLWAASRLARRDLPLHAEVIELGALVNRVVKAAAPIVEVRGQHLTVKLPLGPQWLKTDPACTEQALTALLDNAAKFTKPGGRIELTAERLQEEIVFLVKDAGSGILAADLPRVTELDARERRFGDGLGIGLALARGLIEEQGGRLEIVGEGAEGGSEFRLVLPALREEAEQPLAA